LWSSVQDMVSLNIGYDSKLIEEVEAYKFRGLQSGNSLDWKRQIEYIIPKFNLPYGQLTKFMEINMVKLIYSLISIP
jgi:hypothetical protein